MKTSETTLREIYDISNKEVKEKMELEFPTLFKKSSILNEAISYLTEEDEEVVKLRKLEKIEGIDNIFIIKISDFYFRFVGSGHYRISYFSPITNKEWTKLVTDMHIIDEFKSTETNDHTQVRLNWLKKYVKN